MIMRIVRKNTFETNSSSTHSITVDTADEGSQLNIKLPVDIEPYWNEGFGWGWDTWRSTDEKSAYVIRCAVEGLPWDEDYNISFSDDYEIIMGIIQKRFENLGIHFEIPDKKIFSNGYVDHGDEYWFSDIKEIYEDDSQLLQFLFSKDSYIKGGNDNC